MYTLRLPKNFNLFIVQNYISSGPIQEVFLPLKLIVC